MKKKIIIASLLIGSLAYSQINVQTGLNTSIGNENPFLDASGYVDSDNNVGKGLYFPTTDLRTWEFKLENIDPGRFSTYFDGMIVYNTGEGEPTTDAGIGGKRSNLTRGFYYFKNPGQTFPDGSVENGEWIRLNDSFANDQEWKFNPDNEHIELVRSGKGEFKNKVWFDKNGGYKNLDFTNYIGYNYPSSATPFVENSENYYSTTYKKTSNISNIMHNPFGQNYNHKNFLRSVLLVDPDETTNDLSINNSAIGTIVDKNYTRNIKKLSGVKSFVKYEGAGNVGYLYGMENYTMLPQGSSSNLVSGIYNHVSTRENRNINYISAQRNSVTLDKTGGNIKNASVNFSTMSYSGVINLEQSLGISVGNYFYSLQSATINEVKAFEYRGFVGDRTNLNIQNNYGLYLEDIKGGINSNYAIYTKAGDIRFGQFKEENAPAERLLAVDADGKLVVGGSSATFTSLWANDADNNLVKLKNLADGTTPRTDSGDDRNSVTIDNEGAITAKGFFGYNGAKIYPDYVFQKYYTGTSDIKANYTFKNLNQVEDFVKTNGHLPGYQSAKEVKAQGYVDIMKTQLTNVEKIEELYLHTIEQEKEIKAQKQQIKAQQKQIEELKTMVQQLLNK